MKPYKNYILLISKEDTDAPFPDKYQRIIVGCVKYDCVLCDWLEGYNKY